MAKKQLNVTIKSLPINRGWNKEMANELAVSPNQITNAVIHGSGGDVSERIRARFKVLYPECCTDNVSDMIRCVVKKHSYEALLAGAQRELYLTLNDENKSLIGTKGGLVSVRCGNLCARYTVVAFDCGFGNPAWGANKHTQYVRVNVGHRVDNPKQEELW
jgi:hypothetical protein